MCDHDYRFQNVVYHYSEYSLPGSSAHARIYEDVYYCVKCLDTKYRSPRTIGNSYQKAIEGTFPK